MQLNDRLGKFFKRASAEIRDLIEELKRYVRLVNDTIILSELRSRIYECECRLEEIDKYFAYARLYESKDGTNVLTDDNSRENNDDNEDIDIDVAEHERFVKNILLYNRCLGKFSEFRIATNGTSANGEFTDSIKCSICGSTEFESNDMSKNKICVNCSTHTKFMETGHTHQDYNRVNIIGKFQYNRDFHFLNCIKQYQGRQNCKIPPEIFDALDKKFQSYGLLVESENPYIRHSKITLQHVNLFLKDLKLTKHYENANAIYFALTNKRVADISHLENDLLEDFKSLLSVYDEMFVKDRPKNYDRKNFMNVNYILYQLLRKRGYVCKLEDFSMLKTAVGKMFHDDICSQLFKRLGWKFTATI